jgi:PAS domain S-box-containing protein
MNTLDRKTILLVEDESFIAVLETEIIEDFGYEVINANTGETAVEIALSNERICLILMDINLGNGIDGPEAARQILKKRNIPIVFLTSHSEKEYVDRVKEITRYGYVIKNSGDFVLRSSIEMAFELFEAHGKISLELQDRKQAEEALRKSEESLSIMLQSIGDAVIATDIDGRITMMNETAEQLTGWSFIDAKSKPLKAVFNIINAETRNAIENPVIKVLETGKIVGLANHTILISRNGTEYHIADSAAPIREKYGNIRGVILVFSDITEKYKAADALKKETAFLGDIIDFNPISIQVLDIDGRTMHVNASFIKLFGSAPPANYSIFSDPLVVQQGLGGPMAKLREGNVVHLPLIYYNPHDLYPDVKDKPSWVEALGFPVRGSGGRPERYVLMHTDITERKLAEDALRENEELLSITLQSIGDAVITTNVDGRITMMNDTAELLTGWSIIDAKNKPLMDVCKIINAETRSAVENPVQKVLESNKTVELANHSILISRDGTEYHIANSDAPIRDKSGNVRGIILVFSDITEKYKTEEVLRASEIRYRRLFETAKDGILILDAQTGMIDDVNPFLMNLLGYSYEQFLGKMIWDIGFLKDIIENKDRFLQLQEKEYIRYETLPLETACGQIIDVEFISNVYETNYKKVIQCNIRDITERKFAEEKIKALLVERELTLKEVHHRVKNNMNIIAGILLLQSKTLKETSAVAALNDARNRVMSMMLLYDKLYRSDDFKEISFKKYISPLVDEIIDNFPNKGIVKVEKNIGDFMIDTKRSSDLGIIINEIITNTMKYAFEGRDNGLITVSILMKDNRAIIAIHDNGIGIPESVNIAHPSGFGLQLVDMMTKALRGTIKIERDNGTKFILEFNL